MITHQEKVARIKEYLAKSHLDPVVTKQTIGISASGITPDVLLSSSVKMLKINRLEVEPDNRDNLKFSTFHGVEDFIKEHIDKDAGKYQKKAGTKMQQKKNLSWLQPGFFTPQIKSVVIGNSLSTNLEGINPLEHYDTCHKVTKLGQGGIESIDAIPTESRNVEMSSFGFFDPVHVVEKETIGVTNFIAHNVVKGKDQKLYRVMKGPDGKLRWVDHETILNSTVKVPLI